METIPGDKSKGFGNILKGLGSFVSGRGFQYLLPGSTLICCPLPFTLKNHPAGDWI